MKRENVKTSIFIPSIPKNFNNVFNIVDIYLNGTIKPDEIIVNLSMFQQIDPIIINNFVNKYHDKVMLNLIKERLYAGPNRQMAANLCSGDIILYQDDDDLPHKRRVEIVKKYFENDSKILLLNHSFVLNNEKINNNFDKIKEVYSNELYNRYFPENKLTDCLKYTGAFGGGFNFPVHAGIVSIRKEVLQKIKWKGPNELLFAPHPRTKTEDYEFNMEALYYLKSHVVIDAPLYYYSGSH